MPGRGPRQIGKRVVSIAIRQCRLVGDVVTIHIEENLTLLADRHHRSLLGGAKTYQLTGEKTSNTRPPRVRFRAPLATELLGGVATAFFVRVS